MWPMVAIAAASAIAQWYTSEQARQATAEERKKMQDLYNKLQMPDFDSSMIVPEEFKVLQQYVPQVAVKVAEANPTLIQESSAMLEGRDAQLSALRRLSGISQQSEDPALMQQLNAASQRSQQQAQSRYESQMQDAQRKGIFGSGMSQVLAAQRGANAMQQGAQDSQSAAAEAYRTRLKALADSAELGGNIRNQDISMQGRNADIINAFNARTATAGQNWQNQRADTINEASRFNIGQNQRAADLNTTARNTATDRQRDRENEGNQTRFANEMRRLGYQGDLSNQRAGDIRSDAQDRNNTIQSVAGMGAMGYSQYDNQDTEKNRARTMDDYKWEAYKRKYQQEHPNSDSQRTIFTN